VTPVPEEPLIDPEVIKDLEEQVQELQYRNPMDIRNLIDYLAEREVAYVLTQEEIVQDLSTILCRKMKWRPTLVKNPFL
jgi:hypothetical protein